MEGQATHGAAHSTPTKQGDTGTFQAVSVKRGGFIDAATGAPAVKIKKKDARRAAKAPVRDDGKGSSSRFHLIIGTLVLIIFVLIVVVLVLWLGRGTEVDGTRISSATTQLQPGQGQGLNLGWT